MTEQTTVRPWYVPMRARHPGETHRVSTPLELLFDLCFVVAVAQAAARLHHAIVENHVGSASSRYLMMFFAIWWAWMNFTWFASAYDTDDVPYRLLALVQIAGSLVLAAGIPPAFDRPGLHRHHHRLRDHAVGPGRPVVAGGRAADPQHRRTATRYAVGVAMVQVYWVLRLFLPRRRLAAARLPRAACVAGVAVPVIAERAGGATTYHPHHIAERYGLFTVIVLGESVTGGDAWRSRTRCDTGEHVGRPDHRPGRGRPRHRVLPCGGSTSTRVGARC